jgi:hypothetical protein
LRSEHIDVGMQVLGLDPLRIGFPLCERPGHWWALDTSFKRPQQSDGRCTRDEEGERGCRPSCGLVAQPLAERAIRI